MYHVLLLDDDPIIHAKLQKNNIFAESGFLLTTHAFSTEQAQTLLAHGNIDLVIASIKPPAADGFDLLLCTANHFAPPLFLLIDTQCNFINVHRSFQLCAFDYLTYASLEDNHLQESLQRAANVLKIIRPDRFSDSNPSAAGLYRLILRSENRLLLSPILTAFSSPSGQMQTEQAKNTLDYVYRKFIHDFPWVFSLVNYSQFPNQPISEADFIQAVEYLRDLVERFRLTHMQPTVSEICRYLVDNIEQNYSVKEITHTFSLSQSALYRLFREQTHLSFSTYYTILKMEYAKYMLVHSNCRIQALGERLGYQIPDYFTQRFKSYSGLTPSAYRKQAQQRAPL